MSAVETGSPDELLEELLLLPPQAASPIASAHTAPADPALRTVFPKVIRIPHPLPPYAPAPTPPPGE